MKKSFVFLFFIFALIAAHAADLSVLVNEVKSCQSTYSLSEETCATLLDIFYGQ